jgi:hypothetical protein
MNLIMYGFTRSLASFHIVAARFQPAVSESTAPKAPTTRCNLAHYHPGAHCTSRQSVRHARTAIAARFKQSSPDLVIQDPKIFHCRRSQTRREFLLLRFVETGEMPERSWQSHPFGKRGVSSRRDALSARSGPRLKPLSEQILGKT